MNELRSIDSDLKLFTSLTFNCKNKFKTLLGVLLSLLVSNVVSKDISLTIVEVFFAHENILREKRLNVIALL